MAEQEPTKTRKCRDCPEIIEWKPTRVRCSECHWKFRYQHPSPYVKKIMDKLLFDEND